MAANVQLDDEAKEEIKRLSKKIERLDGEINDISKELELLQRAMTEHRDATLSFFGDVMNSLHDAEIAKVENIKVSFKYSNDLNEVLKGRIRNRAEEELADIEARLKSRADTLSQELAQRKSELRTTYAQLAAVSQLLGN
ncbi:MAG: hypothetical protein FWH40_04745 [Coriobacteriia bacterium]|nr:hypothetical protein [Coriobacteriia bacterium]